MDDPRLFGGKQLVLDSGEVGEQDRDLALGDLVRLSLRHRPGPSDHLRRGQQLLEGEVCLYAGRRGELETAV